MLLFPLKNKLLVNARLGRLDREACFDSFSRLLRNSAKTIRIPLIIKDNIVVAKPYTKEEINLFFVYA